MRRLILTYCLSTLTLMLSCSPTFSTQVQTQVLGTSSQSAPQTLGKEKVEIRLFRSYGTSKMLKIRARIIEYESTSPKQKDSSWRNFLRNLTGFGVDEIEGAKVKFTLQGQSYLVTSDKEGMLTLDAPLKRPLVAGQYSLEAEVLRGQMYFGRKAMSPLTILTTSSKDLGIISDIDDTIKYSKVTNKIEAAKKLFFQSPFDAKEIKGTPALYRILEERIDGRKNDGDIFYVSGSPINFSPQIYTFLDYKKFPIGSVSLKKWGFGSGSDNPLSQTGYKLRVMREILTTYPLKQFLCFGDSGEADAEIYKKLSKEFPGQVTAIFINHVTPDSPTSAKYKGVHLTKSTAQAADILLKMGILRAEDIAKVSN